MEIGNTELDEILSVSFPPALFLIVPLCPKRPFSSRCFLMVTQPSFSMLFDTQDDNIVLEITVFRMLGQSFKCCHHCLSTRQFPCHCRGLFPSPKEIITDRP